MSCVFAELGGAEISCIDYNGERWLRALDVGKALGYKKSGPIKDKLNQCSCKKFKDLVGHTKGLDSSITNALYVDLKVIPTLLTKVNMPAAVSLAQQHGINVETKFLRKEVEIVGYVQTYLTGLGIPFEFQKTVKGVHNYRVDLYLPAQRLAIEIDEFGHADRDPVKEKERQLYIEKQLKCKFLRFNPDDPKFNFMTCMSQQTLHIYGWAGT